MKATAMSYPLPDGARPAVATRKYEAAMPENNVETRLTGTHQA